jgi:hypothetical protein
MGATPSRGRHMVSREILERFWTQFIKHETVAFPIYPV